MAMPRILLVIGKTNKHQTLPFMNIGVKQARE